MRTIGVMRTVAGRPSEPLAPASPNMFANGLSPPGCRPVHMSTDSADDGSDVGDRVHHTSWSANLEGPEHAESRERVVREAIRAIEHTGAGYHVNLVTHETHGHPSTYLYEELEELTERFPDGIDFEFVDQCGCGGYVTRVHVDATAGDGSE